VWKTAAPDQKALLGRGIMNMCKEKAASGDAAF